MCDTKKALTLYLSQQWKKLRKKPDGMSRRVFQVFLPIYLLYFVTVTYTVSLSFPHCTTSFAGLSLPAVMMPFL